MDKNQLKIKFSSFNDKLKLFKLQVEKKSFEEGLNLVEPLQIELKELLEHKNLWKKKEYEKLLSLQDGLLMYKSNVENILNFKGKWNVKE